METIFIYSLSDPINENIRYIGKSTNPERRLKAHLSRSRYGKYHSAVWINSLWKNGIKPILTIIEECTEDNWQERERYWISYYRNIYDLTNILDGGEGCATYGRLGKPWTDEHRINNRKARLGKSVNHTKQGNINRANGVRKYCDENKKPVMQYDLNGSFIKEWQSAVIAGKELKLNYSNINSVCNNLRKHSGKFKWKFKGEE